MSDVMESKAVTNMINELRATISDIECEISFPVFRTTTCRRFGCVNSTRYGGVCRDCNMHHAAELYSTLSDCTYQEAMLRIQRYLDSYAETQNLRSNLLNLELNT